MPRLIPRARRWKNDELVRPLRPVSIRGVVLNPRDRLRGDDPLVRTYPGLFVLVESSTDELREAYAEDFASRPLPLHVRAEGVHVPDPIPIGEAVVALETFTAGGIFNHRYIEKGQRVRRDDPLVLANPTLFQKEATPFKPTN